MIDRLLITFVVLGITVLVTSAGFALQKRRVASAASGSSLLSTIAPGTPAILYFWSEACVPCRTVQKPALEQLTAELGENNVQVIAIDATRDVDIAEQWSVMSLPTTIVLDSYQKPIYINNRPTRLDELKKQVFAAQGR